jgi:hypothetical protein
MPVARSAWSTGFGRSAVAAAEKNSRKNQKLLKSRTMTAIISTRQG